MLYKFIFSKHFTNLEFKHFRLENDFEYSPFSQLVSFKSCQAL